MNMIGQMLLKCAISDTGWNQVDLIKLMGISPHCTLTKYTMSRCLCHENAWYHSYEALPLLAGLILLSNDTILTQYDNLVWTYPNKPVSMWQPWLDHWHWKHQQVERQRYTASTCAQSHSTAKLESHSLTWTSHWLLVHHFTNWSLKTPLCSWWRMLGIMAVKILAWGRFLQKGSKTAHSLSSSNCLGFLPCFQWLSTLIIFSRSLSTELSGYHTEQHIKGSIFPYSMSWDTALDDQQHTYQG